MAHVAVGVAVSDVVNRYQRSTVSSRVVTADTVIVRDAIFLRIVGGRWLSQGC
jgi:hypothetical protein